MERDDIIYNPHSYEKVIVYGAGVWGSVVLKWLNRCGMSKKKIAVWDKNYKNIENKHGFQVSKPDFKQIDDSYGIFVIIALSDDKNAMLISEVSKRFYDAGYQTVVPAREIIYRVKDICIDDFENKSHFDCTYQDEINFEGMTPPIKPIAFYLPQFHDIPENDEWWGKGFTEWTNTRKSNPNFMGHYQPREPHDDLGYYDLSDVNAIRKQAELAKRHGIYGWCIYYYWFSGKKLLTKPIDLLLENKDIDMDFCLMWCNETWSKRWIGDHKTELIANEYTEIDPESFIDDLKKYMEDTRYIRLNGKPLIMILSIKDIPDVDNVIRCWRKRAMDIGIGEISVLSAIHPTLIGDIGMWDSFEGETDFAPIVWPSSGIRLTDKTGNPVSANLRYYKDYVENYIQTIENGEHTAYLSCACGYDNTPRYGKMSSVLDLGFSFESFYNLVKYVTEKATTCMQEYMFLFAWNEWAESAYLEPDKRFGYAMLNTFSKALYGLPFKTGTE